MMVMAVVIVLLVVLTVGGGIARRVLRRRRWVRRLERAEKGVAAAVADGRIASLTGEALLQHLEGLRRVAGGGEV